MLLKHYNRHVLFYQTEKYFDACNGSYCPKQNLYFNYFINWEDGTIEVFHNSPYWNFYLVLSNICLNHLPKDISDFHSNDFTNLS